LQEKRRKKTPNLRRPKLKRSQRTRPKQRSWLPKQKQKQRVTRKKPSLSKKQPGLVSSPRKQRPKVQQEQ